MEPRDRGLAPRFVHVHVPAEGGAEVGVVVEGWGEGLVEAVADGVVAVEEVDELAA